MSLGGTPEDLQKRVGNLELPGEQGRIGLQGRAGRRPQQMVDQIRNLDTDQVSILADLRVSLSVF